MGSTMPLPTVAATFRWNTKIATKLKNAANATALCGRSTPVETTVAMELAASCSPFMKSKASASSTRNTSTVKLISTSGILERDAFGQVCHVEAAVGDRLEQLVDGLHLDDLAHVLLLAEEARHRGAHHAVGVGLEAVDFLAGLHDDLELAVLDPELRHHVLHALAALEADVREPRGLGRDVADVVERQRVRRVLDQVADVVQRVDELVDVVAVERRDERLVQQPDRLGGDAVGGVLGLVDQP